jgi:hypothetical protein
MGFKDLNGFQEAIHSAKPLFIKLFADVYFCYKVSSHEGASQPQLHIARNIIKIQIPILEIPFQGDASRPHVDIATND